MSARELIAEDVVGRHIVRTWRRGDDYGTTTYCGTTAIAGCPYDSLAAARLGHQARVNECRQWAEGGTNR